ncbi:MULTISPECIES: MutS-related protein [unclassified Carboxylicivirga]|uniref:MutS-related protein n=1 Tax=Carboxylicivirga TaxID=1628153 RepID=UPI003D32DCBC
MGAIDGGQRVNDTKQFYTQSLGHWQVKEQALKRRFVVNAWLRLVFFVAAFSLPFMFFHYWSLTFFIAFALLFIAFMALVWRAGRIRKQREYVKHRSELIAKELACIDGTWIEADDGAAFMEHDHDYAHDLDLFGKGSLFQFINRTVTPQGAKCLADQLKHISCNRTALEARQAAMGELAKKSEFRQHFYALAALAAADNKRNEPLDLTRQPDLSFLSKGTRVLIFGFLLTAILVVFLILTGVLKASLLLVLFFSGLGVVGLTIKKINKAHSAVSSLGRYLQRYSHLIRYVEQNKMETPYLLGLKNTLIADGQSASEITARLSVLIQRFDQRLNMLLGVVLNGFLLWDLLVCMQLQGWYAKHGGRMQLWMDALHEMEALNSFATFVFNHPQYVFPKFSDSTILQARQLGHPLIPGAERVRNDFAFDEKQRVCVVTGANMAGKSTFLRTVGVSLVLAGNGCVVDALEFTYKSQPFITNMRATDNLLKHESYFFAELSRLQRILAYLKEQGSLFFILDEILKGTNSLDKYQGSMALIKHLLKHGGTGLVATHDLELGQLAAQTQGQVFNRCFEVQFVAGELRFDYKLRTGLTQSHNASYLMARMGLIPREDVRL